MPGHLILLLALVSAEETCLLQLKSTDRIEVPKSQAEPTRLMLTATGETITIHAAIEMQRAWQKRHSALKAEFGRYAQHARQDPKYMDVGGVAVDPSTFGKVASDTIKNEPDGIMDFIKRSIASEQTCNAKMVEVRRTLDGILAKVNQLSDVTEAQEAIIDANTELISENKDSQERQKDEYEKAQEACQKKWNEAMLALQTHREDQEEMEQIANPDVRSKIGFHTNYTKEVEEHADIVARKAARWAKMEETAALARQAKERQDAEQAAAAAAAAATTAAPALAQTATAPPAPEQAEATAASALAQTAAAAPPITRTAAAPTLVQANSTAPHLALLEASHMYSVGAALYAHIPHLSMSQCQALVQTLEERSGHKLLQDPAAGTVPDDAATIDKCNGTRTELQRVFNETWNNLAKLIKDGEELADKELKACRVAAETEHEEKMDAYEDKVGMATTNINAATQTLNQLSSLLKNSQTEATLLQDYLSTIKADCTIQGDVSEHMEAVLKMIHVLEDCPGRNDFRLIIPGSLTDRIGIGSDTPSPTPEGWEG